ncbi:hypothetical protein V4C53_30150 [Paraburkholderia azotifigens]|uniref:phage tail fiber protein n=1 Tax=Paraburkholderia azotifigens TaxID=2057004 RepID=UPI00316FFB29
MNPNLIDAMPAILAAARTGRILATGELAIDAKAVREAAQRIGYKAEFSPRELGDAMRVIGAQRGPNSPTGARYRLGVMRINDAVERALQSVRYRNHLSGPIQGARLVASDTYPVGIDLAALADDDAPNPDALVTIPTSVIDVGEQTGFMRYSRGCALSVHIVPDSSEDRDLSILRGTSYDVRSGSRVAGDRVELSVRYMNGDTVAFKGGCFLSKERFAFSTVYNFFFSDVIKESI